jgi:hypothetical protein
MVRFWVDDGDWGHGGGGLAGQKSCQIYSAGFLVFFIFIIQYSLFIHQTGFL